MLKIRGKIIDIGMLNKKIKFQRCSGVPDGAAGTRPAWSDMKFANNKSWKWAYYDNTSGLHYSPYAGGMVYMDAATFYLQYCDEIRNLPTGDMRIVYPISGVNARTYRIEGINPVNGEDFFLEINTTGNEMEL